MRRRATARSAGGGRLAGDSLDLIHTSNSPNPRQDSLSGRSVLASIWRIEGAGQLFLCLREAGQEVGGGFAPDTPEGFAYLVGHARSIGARREGDHARPPR